MTPARYNRHAFLTLGSLAALVTTAFSTTGGFMPAAPKPKPEPKSEPVPMVAVLTTAYSGGAQCNGAWAHRNAIGGKLKSGEVNSAAADWSRFPLGTKFRVVQTGQIYQIDDYGSAMVGKDKIDLFMPSYSQVDRWGKRDVTIEIIEWGSPEKSLEILKPRARVSYVRRMVEALKDNLEDSAG
jgi:3D (Asp-Asp-Asp) domain-containing protein